MKIGYTRVSTDEQNLCLQLDALQATGCEIIFRDEGMPGASTKRPGLTDALNALKPGDVLTVWRLDRLGRSLPHLIELLAKIGEANAGFRSITESIDTTTAGGKLVFHVIGAIAEFERSLISERTRADHGDDPRQNLTHRPLGKPLIKDHPRVDFLNGFSYGLNHSQRPCELPQDYRLFSLCLGCVSNTRPPEGLYENLAWIVAMVLYGFSRLLCPTVNPLL